MTFEQYAKLIAQQFEILCATGKLFISSVTGDQLWNLYINNFLPEHNPVFRDPESSTHNCNLDKSWIRRYGRVVAIDENFTIITPFDIIISEDSPYYRSNEAMKNALKNEVIQDVFFENISNISSVKTSSEKYRLGVEKNFKMYNKEEVEKFGVVKENYSYTFYHFYSDLPNYFVINSNNISVEAKQGEFRDAKNVFKRGLDEIPIDTLLLVRDLILQGSLLDGNTHLNKLNTFIELKQQYDNIPTVFQNNWTWITSYNLIFAKFRNELIGTLCTELAEGVEINKACQTWNKRVDPANYMKATAPITKQQIELAKKFVEENGYAESFNRRFATIDDINVNEIIHSNIGNKVVKTASIFDSIPSTSTRHKKSQFDGIEEITIDKFMSDILPNISSIEAFVENRMKGNFVTLTTANEDSKKPFKWNNPFSWTFNGNFAGKSQIAENVKSVGGKIDAYMRCSLQWNDSDTVGIVDFDLHCTSPDGKIYYGDKVKGHGQLDVDMIRPRKIGIENIYYTDKSKIRNGRYSFEVINYDGGRNKGFKIEIVIGEDIYSYYYSKEVKRKISIATIDVINGEFNIIHHLNPINSETSSSKIWGIETNQFQKVNLVCLSPNHWGENNVGNKHYMFMLENCYSDTPIRSFHNENLNSDLVEHRKVFEVLGATNMLSPTKKQLAGLGFNSTVKDELIVKLSGTHKRTIKIKF